MYVLMTHIYSDIICPPKSLIYLQKRPGQDPYIHIYAEREVQGGEDP